MILLKIALYLVGAVFLSLGLLVLLGAMLATASRVEFPRCPQCEALFKRGEKKPQTPGVCEHKAEEHESYWGVRPRIVGRDEEVDDELYSDQPRHRLT